MFYELVDCRINLRRYLVSEEDHTRLRRVWYNSVGRVTDYGQKD